MVFLYAYAYTSSLILVVEGGKGGRLESSSIANTQVRGPQRDVEGLEGHGTGPLRTTYAEEQTAYSGVCW
jgi:hypothetical protein